MRSLLPKERDMLLYFRYKRKKEKLESKLLQKKAVKEQKLAKQRETIELLRVSL